MSVNTSVLRMTPCVVEARRSGLIMTDVGMLLVLFLAVFYAMDPFILYVDKRTIFKHLHLMLGVAFFVLAWVGGRVQNRCYTRLPVSPIAWPVILLALWIVGGSLYARFHSGVVESFLIMGMYMFVLLGAARFIAEHRDPTRLLNAYLMFLIISIVIGAIWQAAQLRTWSKFHEMEALTIPLAVYFFVLANSRAGQRMAMLFMVLLMLLVIKNTSFIVMFLAVSYIWLVFVRPVLNRGLALRRWLNYFGMFVFGLVIAGGYFAIKAMSSSALPDGNPKYRLFTYERTWAGFQESPLIGKSFAGAGAEKFGLFEVGASTQILPSHSDLLDILAQGGVIGMALLVYGVWRITAFLHKSYKQRRATTLSRSLEGHFHWLAVSSIASIPVIAFNPVMLQPGKAFLLWMNVGILLGLGLRCQEDGAKREF